CQQYYYFPVTF
nr:immunoglobulin light chain junction region [Macaca mulatta]MOV75392.1 immunoglobulin light chain junction region [Macaca mulatta]MOV76853.1 immunoglobulin light chain junction region [Macaca mulatta]MOV77392.1 immunoglobulin light chain junction region [Macaca mulatta]